jgi:hypothetical protein
MQYDSTVLTSSTPDLTDQSFERLVVIRFAGYRVYRNGSRIAHWTCQCLCGRIKDVAVPELYGRKTRSCGCLRAEVTRQRQTVHGQRKTAEYRVWTHMLGRCENPSDARYADYGGRGIVVCERWHAFVTFYADMGPKPTPAHTLDRYPDNNGNYEPGNTRWATRLEQAQNKRNNRLLTLGNITQCLAEWARVTSIDHKVILMRVNRGWSDEKALITPVRTPRTHCKYGHPLSGTNLYLWERKPGSFDRFCRKCHNNLSLASHRRRAKKPPKTT